MSAEGSGDARGAEVWRAAKRSVIEHYESVLAQYGPTAQGMEWKDEASQRLRFAVLSEVCNLSGKRLHEIGAGAGHFADFLQDSGITVEYSGSDISPAMVAAARLRHPEIPFEVRDVLQDPPSETYDVVTCSGVFNVRKAGSDAEWGTFIREAVRRMYAMCSEAIAFNLMSDQVDFRNEVLHYADAGDMLDFCRRELSRFVTLRHEYPLYEYTIYVYRDAMRPAAG